MESVPSPKTHKPKPLDLKLKLRWLLLTLRCRPVSRTPLRTYPPTADEHRRTESEQLRQAEKAAHRLSHGFLETEPLSTLGAEAKVGPDGYGPGYPENPIPRNMQQANIGGDSRTARILHESLAKQCSHPESRGSHFSCCQVQARSVPLEAATNLGCWNPNFVPKCMFEPYSVEGLWWS